MSGPRLTFLGTADSKGVPRFWCTCAVCQEARETGLNRRTRTGLLLQGAGETVLLDASADLHAQLAARPGPLLPDRVIISHAHNDHLLGLGDLLDYRLYAAGSLDLRAPATVVEDLRARFAYAFRAQNAVEVLPEEGLPAAGLTIRAFEVPHGANGQSHAFRLERPGWAGVVMTDALDVPPELARRWLGGAAGAGLDLLVLGTSFADESAAPRQGRSVYDIAEALSLPWAHAARRVVLTHLSHGVDARTTALPPGWTLAHDGLSLPLW
ncbi:MBL fold metallo-hydrolase [Deinococcus hohokamensis]|uniref:MBL fold metallo-hydrolase n=1 Tax=Deinococcus hohokamensis TaxID=309883 RepID=A0ABV9I643_9DEIO